MKDWVRPLLRLLRDEKIVNVECWEDENSHPPLCWRRVGDLFMHQFESEVMLEIFGSVLCDLPKDVFDQLFAMNPFFVYSKSAGFCQMLHVGKREDIPLVVFSQGEMKDMNWSERRGCIVHELAHCSAAHLSRPFSLNDPYRRELEAEADSLASSWGFQQEIATVRKFLKQKGENSND